MAEKGELYFLKIYFNTKTKMIHFDCNFEIVRYMHKSKWDLIFM